MKCDISRRRFLVLKRGCKRSGKKFDMGMRNFGGRARNFGKVRMRFGRMGRNCGAGLLKFGMGR